MNKVSFIPARTVALVGMMASGKSSVGVRVAERLDLPFFDSDKVIEKESGITIAEYFNRFGEPKFRILEKETIARLLSGPPCVLALGGGAFVNAETRALLKCRAVTIWIKAEKAILLERASRHNNRPLLQGDPEGRMTALLAEREPIYAQADFIVESGTHPIGVTVTSVLEKLEMGRVAQAQGKPHHGRYEK